MLVRRFDVLPNPIYHHAGHGNGVGGSISGNVKARIGISCFNCIGSENFSRSETRQIQARCLLAKVEEASDIMHFVLLASVLERKCLECFLSRLLCMESDDAR